MELETIIRNDFQDFTIAYFIKNRFALESNKHVILDPRLAQARDAYGYYENFPMQYTQIFSAVKMENFQLKSVDIFLIFAQNIDCGYTLEPPRRGGSNEYPQSMFWSKDKKNTYTPACPNFAI